MNVFLDLMTLMCCPTRILAGDLKSITCKEDEGVERGGGKFREEVQLEDITQARKLHAHQIH